MGLFLLLAGCSASSHVKLAPVVNLNYKPCKISPQKISPEKKSPEKNSPENSQWLWPTQGKIIKYFEDNYGGNKGINISGKLGQNIKASGSGQVVYAGSGLKGYGLLIIIKHNSKYLSAYAHNKKLFVKEGQKVKQGQVIAEMGRSDSPTVMLHFEIRQSGKPVDPMKFLPACK